MSAVVSLVRADLPVLRLVLPPDPEETTPVDLDRLSEEER